MSRDVPEKFSRFLLANHGMRAVWPPTSPFKPGDFGKFENGVFRKLGNVNKNFDVKYKVVPGGQMDISMSSSQTRETKFQGGVKVQTFTKNIGGSGRIEISFRKKHSFYFQAKNCKSKQVESIYELSQKIADEVDSWRHSLWWVLSEVYEAPSCIILASKNENSKVKLSGDVKALIKVVEGKVDADISVTGKSNMKNCILGKKGPVMLGIFRVRIGGNPRIK
jgi:hypothetical protein